MIKVEDNNIKMYSLNIPTRVYYGRDIIDTALEELYMRSEEFMGQVLIVTTGGSLYRWGHIEHLTGCINKHSDSLVLDNITANPKLAEIERCIENAKEFAPTCVVGFGGGSSIDSAKAIAAGLKSDITVTEMFRSGIAPSRALPVIAIPTTSGTGSELSKAAILNDTEKREKGGLRGEVLFPYTAIVDPSFTDSVPMNVSMETGFDVLAHAIESYVSLAASPFTEMLSEYVISHAGEAIKKLADDLQNKEARDVMSYCSMIMGINLGNASTALPHRMQYPVGAYSNSSHGAGLAALFPVWMKYEEKYSSKRIENVNKLLQVKRIEELLEIMGIRRSLEELGITEDTCAVLGSEVKGNVNNDLLSKEPGIIDRIYKESWRY